MNAKNIVYWIATAFTAFVFLSGGVVDVIRPEPHGRDGSSRLSRLFHGDPRRLEIPRRPHHSGAAMGIDKRVGIRRHVLRSHRRLCVACLGWRSAIKIATPLIILGIVIASWAVSPREPKDSRRRARRLRIILCIAPISEND